MGSPGHFSSWIRAAPLKKALPLGTPPTQGHNCDRHSAVFLLCYHIFLGSLAPQSLEEYTPFQLTSDTEGFVVRTRLHDPIGQRCAGRDPTFLKVSRELAEVTRQTHTSVFLVRLLFTQPPDSGSCSTSLRQSCSQQLGLSHPLFLNLSKSRSR